MTDTATWNRMLSPYARELGPELGLLVFEGHVRASDVRLALASPRLSDRTFIGRCGSPPPKRGGCSDDGGCF